MPHQRLKVGIAELDITPGTEVELAAEFQSRKAKDVAVPLMAKALVLSNEVETLAVVTLDLFGLNPPNAAELEDVISKRVGIKPEALMVVCSRTRAAPCTTPLIGVQGINREFIESLFERVPVCVERALMNLQEASLGAGKAILPHLVYNHRLMTRNYKAISAWLGVPINEVLEPEGPTDPCFTVITLRDKAGFPICLLWNFAADFHFEPGNRISSGIPGEVQKVVDARLGRHIPLFYLPGCGGNISFTWDESRTVDALASAIIAVYLETPCDPYIGLGSSAESMILPVRDYSQLWQEADIELKYPQGIALYQQELAWLQREGPRAISTQVKAFRLGRFGLVGFPGMPFVEFALQVKDKSAFAHTLVAGSVGGDIGLIIPRQSFEAGGYETWPARSALVASGGGEFMVEMASRLLANLYRSW